jgi:class 3 adenylate cyclase
VRPAEWTEATTRWCERQSVGGFPGICRVHRAEIMRMKGAWPAAEEEARRACEELPKFNLLYGLGYAFYEIAEVRRRMGDFAGAEEAYNRAHEYGSNSQPGLSLLRLAQGKAESAAAGVRSALADESGRLSRVKLLAAQAEIAIAVEDVETARAASAELDSIVNDVATTGLEAIAATVRGRVLLAGEDAPAAVPDLRRALHSWQEIEAPYEAAEVRVLLANAYRALGDSDGALMELRSARDAFERLGAVWASAETGRLLKEMAGPAPSSERVRRAFVFTDIVKSTDLVNAIGDEAWEDLLSWHDQTLRSVFASHGGEVVNHTGDGFFVAFPTAAKAIAGAISVQRVLADHRRQTGFAPVVRIGVHAAEATRRGQDYGGGEVHKAARIAALAEGWEILASDDTLAETDGTRFGEYREVVLKGFSTPVKVAPVEWRDPQ